MGPGSRSYGIRSRPGFHWAQFRVRLTIQSSADGVVTEVMDQALEGMFVEAGMNLYGTDMDESISPLESGLGWTIAWDPPDRDFIGRLAIEHVRANEDRQKLVGLLLQGKGILRNHQRVAVEGREDGEITSGGFSPTMQRSIAMARVPAGDYGQAQVDVRGRLLDVSIVRIPFVRNGKILTDLG